MTDTADTIDCADPATRAELVDIVMETLDGLVGSSFPGGGPPDVEHRGDLVIHAELQMVGDTVEARLVLRVAAATAVAITAAMADERPDDIALEDATGTVAELCNVLGGTVKTLFAEETALRVPRSAVGAPAELEPLETVDVTHSLGHFQIHVGA